MFEHRIEHRTLDPGLAVPVPSLSIGVGYTEGKKAFFFKSNLQQVYMLSNGIRGKELKEFSKNFHFPAA